MKKNFLLINLILIILLILTSCNKTSEVTNTPTELQDEINEEKNDTTEINDEKDEIEEIKETEDDTNKVLSPLDGLKYYPEELNKRPIAVSIDNHPDARWQAGLQDAEIVYEFDVEFPYTRYLAVFLAKEPEMVGPVRSARPYIIYYALENDGIFVHVGGSQDAFNEIERLKIADVDGLYSGAMWRYYDTGKVAPHNMYTTLKSIRDEGERKGYRTEGNLEGYNFNEKPTLLSDQYKTEKANKINIMYNNYNTTDYIYDVESKLYLRYKDNEKHIDELTNEQIKVKNIIALEASKTVLDNEGRLELGTVGEGYGLYFSEGEATEITWVKKSEKERTKFYIEGKELNLNPGNTWIQVVEVLKGCVYFSSNTTDKD